MSDTLESILVVYQNPVPGKQEDYDDWYTNIHIRDAMRLDGAIATQRFIVGGEQPLLDGHAVKPSFWAHTIYEWESALKSVEGHSSRAGTPLMEISRDCDFEGLRDYFYRPEFLSHGWTRQSGFRRGTDILTALVVPSSGDADGFVRWFREDHVPATLETQGVGSVGLFSLHEAQSLPYPAEYPFVAIYGLTDRSAALRAWAERHDSRSPNDLSSQAEKYEIGCWQPRIERLRAEAVAKPDAAAVEHERQARERHKGNYLTKDELGHALHHKLGRSGM